jgi:hypothetical protein
VGTFFGNILNFPTHFLIRKSPGNTVNGLNTSQAGDISVKLAGKILNVLGIFWVGIGQVLCPFPCNVFVMYWVRTSPLAPSVSRKRRTTDLRKRSRRWARNDDDSEEDERGGFWQEESSGEESSSSDERNIKDSDSEEFIRLVMQGEGGKAARTHHESGVGQDGETIAQDTGSLRKRTTGSRVVREPRPTWSVEDKDDVEESMETNPARKGITEWPRNTNEPISARRRPQTLATAVRRSRRTRNDTWGSGQKQWDLIQERCTNRNSARGSHAQPRNAQILFSIARKDPALGPKQNNGLTTHQDGLETPDVTARPPNPLTQSSSRRTNRNPAERDRGRSAKPKALSVRENIVAELTDISSEDPEVQGNSRSAASPEEFPRHETVGVGRDKQDSRSPLSISLQCICDVLGRDTTPCPQCFSLPLSSDHSRTRYALNIVRKLPTTLGHPLSLSSPRVSRSTTIRIVRDD